MTAVQPLRIRRFRVLWMASIVSNLGSFLQSVAASWLMLELTNSAAWVGWMVASTTLPLLFLALAAGALADLTDRTRLLLSSQIVMCLAASTMALVTHLGAITPVRLLALGFVMGIAGAFNLPAWQALVPDLVPRELVASAVALNSVAFNVARSVGPALGGVLVVTAGPAAGFALNAASYLGVIVVVAALGRRLEPVERETGPLSTAIAQGLRYARHTPIFRRILMLAALFAMTSAVVQSTLPNYTRELGLGAATYGILLGSMGAGALLAWLGRDAVVRRLGRRSVPTTMTLFGMAGIVMGLSTSPVAAVAALLLAGACWVWTLTTLNATTQLLSPDWIRGRNMSLYSLSFVGVVPLGSILAGTVADLLGAHGALILLSAAGTIIGLSSPRLRLPALAEVQAPAFTRDPTAVEHIDTAEGGPVMVINTWVIDDNDFPTFLDVMTEVRMVRLRTGAYRWRLYRNAGDPHQLNEVFLTVSWEEHLAQHRRIDDVSVELLRQARGFDRAGGPVTQHLVAVDVVDPANRPDWQDLVAAHEEMHLEDESISVEQRPPAP